MFFTLVGNTYAKRLITRYENGEKQVVELNRYQTSVCDFIKQYKSSQSKLPKKVIGESNNYPEFTVKMEYDETQNIIPLYVHAGYPDYGLYWYVEGENSIEIQIPEEIKVVECSFGKYDNNGDFTALYYVFKEVGNLPEHAVINCNYAEADNKIKFVPLKEDGTVLKPAIQDRDNDRIIEENDCLDGFGEFFIWHKEYGKLDNSVYFLAHTIDDGQHRIIDLPDIYINNVDEKYGASASLVYNYNNENFNTIIKYPTWTCNPQSKETILSNSPSDFKLYEQSFARSKFAKSVSSQVKTGDAYIFESIGYDISSSLGVVFDDPVYVAKDDPVVTKHRVCAKPATHIGNDIFDLYLTDSYQANCLDETGEEYDCFEATSLPWVSGEKGREYKPFIFPESQSGMFIGQSLAFKRENSINDWLFVCFADSLYTNKLVYTDAQQVDKLNNSCPILTGLFDYYEGMGLSITPEYVGRYNEYNEIALNTLEMSQSNSGEEYVINLSNTEFCVDGNVDAKNDVKIVVKNGVSDQLPPVLRTLTFKNNNGQITDRFGKPEDGVVEFYVADFYVNYDWKYAENEGPIYEIASTITAKVEYAPYQSENYAPLNVSEDVDKFFEYGCGQFFSGSLGCVNAYSANDWYDLRITLTDAVGNTQIQTISPAFKIDSHSSGVHGVNNTVLNIKLSDNQLVVENAENVTGAIYNIAGQLVKNVKSSTTDVSMLTKGVYIVNVNGITKKIAVK